MVINISFCARWSLAERHKLAERKVVINLLLAEDIDLDAEQIDIYYENYDQKLELSDKIAINQFYIPTMAIRNDDNSPVTHNFLKHSLS